jgi:hypothetical protein
MSNHRQNCKPDTPFKLKLLLLMPCFLFSVMAAAGFAALVFGDLPILKFGGFVVGLFCAAMALIFLEDWKERV